MVAKTELADIVRDALLVEQVGDSGSAAATGCCASYSIAGYVQSICP